MSHEAASGPLAGFRVLELGNFIAAPYAGRLFAEFGAEVIKVERPRTGDELRQWRLFGGHTSMMWYTQARNKQSVTLDLRSADGQAIVRQLAAHVDLVIENFRPGTLEGWGIGFAALRAINPDLVLVRISGYGQSGPYRDRPGFASVAEAIGGMRGLVGYPDRPPTRVGVSLGDSLAGMFGALGGLMALLRRERGLRLGERPGDGRAGFGQVVDVALYEAVFAMMESMVPEYDAHGVVRRRSGNLLPGIAPSNVYPCLGEKWVAIGGNADGIFRRLMLAIERPDLADDARFAGNPGRWEHHELLDDAIAAWTAQRTMDEAMVAMVAADVPAGPIYDATDIVADPHFAARGMVETHQLAIGDAAPQPVRFPGVVPQLSETPGGVRWLGHELGAHNQAVYGELLGMDAAAIAGLRERGVI